MASALVPGRRCGRSAARPRPPEERLNVGVAAFFARPRAVPGVAPGVTRTALVLFAVLFVGRAVFVTAGYHRYFSHRTYRREPGLALRLGGPLAESTAQKGRVVVGRRTIGGHHRSADTPDDPHSPRRGRWWSHVGWILCDKFNEPDYTLVKDFARYRDPELRWLDRHEWVPPWTLGVLAFLIGGWPGLVVGFFWSTVLLWHTTFLVNSAGHLFGRRRYETPDTSRNSPAPRRRHRRGGLAQQHHHRYPASARQGFFWWEVDPTWYFLRVCRRLGIVHDLKVPPRHVLEDRSS